jgi:hypothetical protein
MGAVGAYSSVLIERASIEDWLSAQRKPPVASIELSTEGKAPADPTEEKHPLRDDTTADYKEWIRKFNEEHKRYPTYVENEKWSHARGLNRDRLRELRRDSRPPDAKKGGAPKKSRNQKLGGT